jgi:transcriptional regulator with XRE-family HTH domain
LVALAATLIRYEQRSGLKKPEFAETIGISGSQYRSIRRQASNPSIIQLATIAEKLRIPLFTLLGVDVPGGKKLSGLKMTAHIALVVGRKCQESGLDRIARRKSASRFRNFISCSMDAAVRCCWSPTRLRRASA